MQGVAVVHHQFGGLRADVDHRDALAPLLRQHRGVAGGQRLRRRSLPPPGAPGSRRRPGNVLLHRSRDQVDVDFQARRPSSCADRDGRDDRPPRNPAGTAAAPCGLPAAARARRGPPRGSRRAARSRARGPVRARRGCWRRAPSGRPSRPPPIPPRRRAVASASRKRRQNRFGHRPLIGDPALHPALRRRPTPQPRKRSRPSSSTQITQPRPGCCPRRVPLRKSVLLPCSILFLCRNAVVQPQIERLHVRRLLANLRVVAQEILIARREVVVAQHQARPRGPPPGPRSAGCPGSAAFTSEMSFASGPRSSCTSQHGAHALAALGFGLVFAHAAQHREGELRLRRRLQQHALRVDQQRRDRPRNVARRPPACAP